MMSPSSAVRHIRVSLAISANDRVCIPSRSMCEIDIGHFVEQMGRVAPGRNDSPHNLAAETMS